MLFLNDCICTRFYFGCAVVKRCKKEYKVEDSGVYPLNTVVYKAELDSIYPDLMTGLV